MVKYAYTKFRDKVKAALEGEKNGLTWSQLKEKGAVSQAHMCYTWARELESDIGLVRETRNHRVYWKLKRT